MPSCGTCGQDLGDIGDDADFDYEDGVWHHFLRRDCCPTLLEEIDQLKKQLALADPCGLAADILSGKLVLGETNVVVSKGTNT